MPIKSLYLEAPNAAEERDGKLEPVTRFRLFNFGSNGTTQGTIKLTEESAAKVMARYEKRTKARTGYLDMDWYHLSRKADSRLEDRRSAGRCKLELVPGDGGGIDVVDILPTAEAKQAIEGDYVRSYSPVVSVSPKGMLLEIVQLSLTNIPAMDDAGLLAAEDGLDIDEPSEELELSVTPFQKLPVYEGATWDAKAADERLRQFLSSDGSGDMDKVDLVKYRKAFVFFDGASPEAMSRYKGQVLDVQNVDDGPELVVSKKAVQTLGGILQGSRGGINVSDEDREKGKAILSRYYKLFNAVAPWDREQEPAVETAMEDSRMPDMHPRILKLAEMGGMMARMQAITEACRGKVALMGFTSCYIEECYDDYCICSCHAYEPVHREALYKIPYTIGADGSVQLGEMSEMVKAYKPKSEAAETMAMQDREHTAHTRLLELTETTVTTEALVKLEALTRDAAVKPVLEARVLELEEERFQVAREFRIGQAKRDGRWTKALEEQGDRFATMARQLQDDPVKALDAHWSSAPVMVAPGGMTQPQPSSEQTIQLSEEEESTLKQSAAAMGLKLEDVRAAHIATKRR